MWWWFLLNTLFAYIQIKCKRSRKLEMMNADHWCDCFGVPLSKVIFVIDAVHSPTDRRNAKEGIHIV